MKKTLSNFFAKLFKREDYFKETNKSEKETIYHSPSGKYQLTVSSYETKPGCWNYTQGTIWNYKAKLFTVKRNYSSFWHLFIEDHPDGHDYMLCGEDYQGQTVLQLDTGKRIDYLPSAAKKGFGFCWVGAQTSPDKTKLAIEGCYWACPYEYVILDFSNPMNLPFKELARADMGEDAEVKWGDKKILITNMQNQRISDGAYEYDIPREEYKALLDEMIAKGKEDGNKDRWNEYFKSVPLEIIAIDWSKDDMTIVTKEDLREKITYIQSINNEDFQYFADYGWDKDGNASTFVVRTKPTSSEEWTSKTDTHFTSEQEWQEFMRNKLT